MAVPVQVVGGVDPHADTIHVAVLTALGKVIGDAEFPTTADGYRRVVVFLTGSGDVERVGVEGAAGYGAGITRGLAAAGTRGRRAILIMAPEPVRARFRALSTDRLVTAVLRCRGFYADPIAADTLAALKILAQRHLELSRQIDTLTARIDPLVTLANPALPAAFGVGPEVAAQVLITTGRNPDRLPQRTLRRRLVRGRARPRLLRQDPPLPAVPRR